MPHGPKKKDDLFQRTLNQELSDDLHGMGSAAKASTARSRMSETKRIRKVSPIGMRILVCVRKDANVSEGGLYLPEGAKNATAESILADVLEVATASDHTMEDDEANISGIPLGAVVLIGKTAGVRVPWDDSLRIVETKEVLAVVHEMSLV